MAPLTVRLRQDLSDFGEDGTYAERRGEISGPPPRIRGRLRRIFWISRDCAANLIICFMSPAQRGRAI